MTTIAYRDGIMASDSGCWIGNASFAWAKKLALGADGTLHGVMGHAAECEAYLQWVRGGCEGSEPKPRDTGDNQSSFSVIRVRSGGPVELSTAYGWERYDAPYFSCGSGAEVCWGALFMGATAEQAIAAALEHGSGAHGQIQTISFRQREFKASAPSPQAERTARLRTRSRTPL